MIRGERSRAGTRSAVPYAMGGRAFLPVRSRDGGMRQAIVDSDVHASLVGLKWTLNRNGYPTRGQRVTLHHIIAGHPMPGFVIDHINGNKLDNRRSNLRVVDHRCSSRNISAHRDNRTGVLGVQRASDRPGFRARITLNGRKIHLGYFATLEDATEARARAERVVFGDEARQRHGQHVP